MADKVSMKDLVREAKEASAQEQQHRPTAQPGDEFYRPPTTSVPLPSRGKVYPPDSPLFDTTNLEVRAMVATDEDIMTSPALLRKGRMISALMKACTVSRTVDPDTMLIGDRNAIMVAIRNSSYGPEYAAEVSCPACGAEGISHTFDLSRLEMRTLDVEPDEPASNSFSFRLPVTGKTVRFRLTTQEMARELDQIQEAQRKAAGPGAAEQNITQGLIHQVFWVEGIEPEDHAKRARFIRQLPVRDSRALRGYIDKVAPSVDMKQEFECPSCGKRTVVEVPLTSEFFWPSA